jgi:Glycosyltransferase family 87
MLNVRRPTLNSEKNFRILTWCFGVVLFAFALVPLLHCLRGHSIKDYLVWYQTGQLVLQGRAVYPEILVQKFDFMYPPPCALFLAPVSWLGQFGLILVLVVINATAWIMSVLCSVYLATGKRGRQHALLYLVPNFIVIVYVWSNFLLGQPSLLLLALMLGAFIGLRQKHEFFAGTLIAVAAAIKAFPVIAIIYLVYRRYWVAAGSLVLVLAFLLVLPVPFRGMALAKQDMERWTSGMLLHYDEGGVAQRAGRSNAWKNQSIFGVANRMLRHAEYDFQWAPHTPVYANVADLKFSTVNNIILGSALMLGLVYIGVIPRRERRTPQTDAIEFALLLLLMLIFTPLSFGYLYVWLLYPFTVIVHKMMTGAGAGLLRWTVAAVALLALTIPNPRIAQTYGSVFFATLLLFIGLANELWRLKREKIPAKS